MRKNKIFLGLYEKALPEDLDWEERFELAKKAGFNFMEISIDESDQRLERLQWDRPKRQKLNQAISNTGMPIVTMCLSANRRFPIASEYPHVEKRGMEILEDAIWFAFHTGIRIIQVAGYDVLMGQEKSTKKSREKFGSNLMQQVTLASKLGVTLGLENVDVDFGSSIENLLYYVQSIDSPWLQLYPDIGNLAAMNHDVLKQINMGKSHIVAVHVKDTTEGVVRRVPYGQGIVDFEPVFECLKRIHFHGPLLMEMWTDPDKDNFEVVKKSRDWIYKKAQKVWNTNG